MDLKKRLARLDRLTSKRTGQSPESVDAVSGEVLERALTGLGLEPVRTPAGEIWVREYRDELAPPTKPLPDLAEFFTRAREANPEPAELLLLDTETTGLAGGTGTLAFLVGVSWWEGEGLVTRQYFLAGPGREAALLSDLRRLGKRFRVVMTFNGASFDLPLLRTRSLMNRLPDPLAELVSWDLLVPARRLWGRLLPDCRQQTLEVEVCGRRRGRGDIEGSQIPQTWFDFLGTGEVGLLPSVLRHNRRDMVGMADLLRRIVDAAAGIARSGQEIVEEPWQVLWAKARICERRRLNDAAASWMAAALSAAPVAVEHPRFVLDAVRILKRVADWSLVEKVIAAARTGGLEEPWLHREAAILYEHRLCRLETALEHARLSGENHRVQRLQRRLRSRGSAQTKEDRS